MSAATSFALLPPSASGQRGRRSRTTVNHRAEWASSATATTGAAGSGQQFVAGGGGGGLTQRCFHAPFPRSSTISAFGKPSTRILRIVRQQHGGVAPTARSGAGHHPPAAAATAFLASSRSNASSSSVLAGRPAGVGTAVVVGGGGGTPSLFTRRGDSLRANAWLGDWMKENLGGGGDKKNKKKNDDEGQQQRKGAAAGDALKEGGNNNKQQQQQQNRPSAGKKRRSDNRNRGQQGVRGRAGMGGAGTTARGAPPSPPIDELTPEEMRPDFGLRRDLHDLYAVKSLDDEEPIGSGSYGIVRRVVRKSDGEEFALKTIRKAPWRQPPTSRTSVNYYHFKLRNEIEVMRKIGSSLSIVYLYDSFEDDDAVHLLMDLCKGGELLGRIGRGMNYSESTAADLVRSVLRTAAQCHSRGIIFRDIKPDNFLFQREDEGSPLQATDFGLAGLIKPGERLTRRCGTPSYMAPEVINRNYGEEADVWSCGVVAYQLLTGRLPFVDRVNQRPNAKEVFRAILEDPIDFESDPWPRLSPDCKDLVSKMMTRDPEKRITARAALLHPWLQQTALEADRKEPIGGQVVARLQRFSTYGLLKRSVLRLLGENLRESTGETGVLAEERELTSEFLELFQLLDTSGDDLVQPEELEAGLKRVGYDISPEECEQILEQLDTTNDGAIDVNEFLAALVDWEALERSSEEYPNWVKQSFEMLDKDGNGTIDAGEVADLVCMNEEEEEGLLKSEAKKTVAACIQEADTDGDGLIDFEEFVTLLQMDPTDQLDAYEWRVAKNGSDAEKEEQESETVVEA